MDAGARPLDILFVGNPVLDVVVRTPQLPAWDDKCIGSAAAFLGGGTEANAACAASRLGLQTALYGELGEGPLADALLAELASFGVQQAHLRRRRGTACAMTVVLVAPAGERAVVYVPLAGDLPSRTDLPQVLRQAHTVYTMPYHRPAFQALSEAAHAAGTEVAIDVEREVAGRPADVQALLAGCDIAFFNEAGFRAATGAAPEAPALRRLLAQARAHTIVVTLGARGALAADRQGDAAQPAFAAQVVDTTGAGDSFNAAFLAARQEGRGLQQALAFGCAAASCCVAALGARAGLPRRAQVEHVLRTGAATEAANLLP
jgi:sugar/nucleoside kinase (ribokinase family)